MPYQTTITNQERQQQHGKELKALMCSLFSLYLIIIIIYYIFIYYLWFFFFNTTEPRISSLSVNWILGFWRRSGFTLLSSLLNSFLLTVFQLPSDHWQRWASSVCIQILLPVSSATIWLLFQLWATDIYSRFKHSSAHWCIVCQSSIRILYRTQQILWRY